LTTTAAAKDSLAQAERFADRAAPSTAPGAGIKPVSDCQLSSIPSRLVGEQVTKQRPGAVGDGTSEVGSNQSRNAQVLDDQVTVGLGQLARVSVDKIMTNIADTPMQLRQPLARTRAVAGARLLATECSALPTKLGQQPAKGTRAVDALELSSFGIRNNCEGSEPSIDAHGQAGLVAGVATPEM
jgi:hypothetical protein